MIRKIYSPFLHIGFFYVHPEIGTSYNYKFIIKTFELDSGLNIIVERDPADLSPETFEIIFCTLMGLGCEINIGTFSVLAGAKGYNFFKSDFMTPYGIGLMVGVKI